jgi:SAM-dependent methyltransferase
MSEPTHNAYDQWAPTCDSSPNPQIVLEFPDVPGLLTPFAEETVLDAGCGSGRYTVAIADRGAAVIGLDFSDEMLTVARRRMPATEFPTADLTKATSISFTRFRCHIMRAGAQAFCQSRLRQARVCECAASRRPSGLLRDLLRQSMGRLRNAGASRFSVKRTRGHHPSPVRRLYCGPQKRRLEGGPSIGALKVRMSGVHLLGPTTRRRVVRLGRVDKLARRNAEPA